MGHVHKCSAQVPYADCLHVAMRCNRVGKQIVNVPSFMVRVDSQKHIDFALNSPFGGGRPGRNKRRNLKCALNICFNVTT